MSDDILDLDALAPKNAHIKFGGKDIEVPPPLTADLLRLGSMSRNMEKVDQLPDEQVEKRVQELTQQIYKMIPELNEVKLGLAQLQGLVQLLSAMAMPPDTAALKAKGITPDTASKTPQS